MKNEKWWIMRTQYLVILSALCLLAASTGCANSATDLLNPYAESTDSTLGQRNNRALLENGGGESQAERARHALNVMGSYRRAQEPEPTYPVIQPAEIRLMWVPDHLNRAGDLVPAHYYYLRVLNDRWAVQDAFELEQQLNAGSSGAGSATPWISK